MTEAEWLACKNPRALLHELAERVSDRKLRLFGCAWWRLDREGSRRWKSEFREKWLHAVQFAEGAISREEFRDRLKHPWRADWFMLFGAREAAEFVCRSDNCTLDSRDLSASEKAELLREIVGNPFRPYAVPNQWPATVAQLARALEGGADCLFALHDALLETGHTELAEHLAKAPKHPRGCWVLDLLLGKK